jgi:hypothetical protein
VSLSPENFDGLGVVAAKTNRSTPPGRPQRLVPLAKSGVSGQILFNVTFLLHAFPVNVPLAPLNSNQK